MLLGTDVRAIVATLDALPIDVIGLNCSTGPAQMRDSVRYMCDNSRCFVSVIPNAGLPLMGPKGETIYPETPAQLANELAGFVADFGVNAVGGCCGSTTEHVRAIARAVAELGPENAGARRAARVCSMRASARSDERPQWAASAMTGVSLMQEPRPLIVGERINSQGSRSDQAVAARREVRRHRAGRARASGGRRASARRLLRLDRTSRRGGADGRGDAQTRAVDRSAAGRRFHRTGRTRSGASKLSRARDRQLRPFGVGPCKNGSRDAARTRAWRRRHRTDDRRKRHGEERRTQTRGGATHLRHRGRASTGFRRAR